MFQKLANSEWVGLHIEKILDDFTWNDPAPILVLQLSRPRIPVVKSDWPIDCDIIVS